MSFTGRYIIDRLKHSTLGRYVKFPVPPYENPNCWEGVYQSLKPDDVFEWGGISTAEDLQQYTYQQQQQQTTSTYTNDSKTSTAPTFGPSITTNLLETLNITPKQQQTSESAVTTTNSLEQQQQHRQSVLVLGCGNSKMGEELLSDHNFPGPIVQVDISARVIDAMSHRCQQQIASNDMVFVQDDARVLSGIEDTTIHAVIDKGTVDALFCTDSFDVCYDIVQTMHRVLTSNHGVFVTFSRSRPEFLLEKLLFPKQYYNLTTSSSSQQQQQQQQQQYNRVLLQQKVSSMWEDIQIRKTDFGMYLYRFMKKKPLPTPTRHSTSTKRHRRKK